MRARVCLAAAVALATLAVGCSAEPAGGGTSSAPITTTEPLAPVTPGTASPTTAPARRCPPPDGVGTTPPAVSIYSITFVVNGREQSVRDGDSLAAPPGSRVSIAAVEVCTEDLTRDGGQACVDIAPLGPDGKALRGQASGTHLWPASAGFSTEPGPSGVWIIETTWRGFVAVVNHWASTRTGDAGCADGACERDDYLTIPLSRPG